MTRWKKILSTIAFVQLALVIELPVAAEDQAEQSGTEAAMTAHEAERAEHTREVEMHMREAEQRLEEAARRIAELSDAELARAGQYERRFEFRSGRPMLGITIGSGSDGEPVEGVKIMGISPSGAADEAGLRSSDIITRINGDSLSSPSAFAANKKLLDFMQGVEEGDVLEIDYLRDGKNGTIELTPTESSGHMFDFSFGDGNMHMPAIPGIPNAPSVMAYSWAGRFAGHGFGEMEMVELNESLGRYFGTDSGLLVIKAPSDNAYQLQDGDVIKNIDGRTPSDLRHAVRILSSYESGESVNIEIMRDKRKKTITVEVPDNRRSFVRPSWPASPASAIVVAPKVKVVRKTKERT